MGYYEARALIGIIKIAIFEGRCKDVGPFMAGSGERWSVMIHDLDTTELVRLDSIEEWVDWKAGRQVRDRLPLSY